MSLLECNKKSFETWQEAMEILTIIKNSPEYAEKERKEARAYECPFCSKFHLTSITRKRKQEYIKAMKKAKSIRMYKTVNYWKDRLGIKD